MASNWKKIELGEIASIIGGGTPSSKIDDYWEGDIPWITPKDLSNHPYKLISRGSRNITQLGLEKSSARLMPAGTLLISSRAPIGYTAIAKNELCTSQGFKSLILKDGYSSDFFYYLIKGNISKLEAVSSGSTFKEISGSTLKKISFIVPPLPEQKAIAHILGSLDDKIELNRQMNETLEAMAQALFKSWFVDFDPVIDNALAAGNAIPDEFIERAEQRKGIEKEDNSEIQSLFPDEFEFTEEMGWIPKGWEISTLGQESDFSNGYAFKSKELTAESKDAFHVFKMGHIKRGGGFNYDGTKSYFPIEAAKDLERYLLKKGDLLMAMTDMKSSMALLGHTALMPEDDKFLVNQRVGRLSVKEDATLNYPYIYIYSNLDTTIGELRSRANSGVQVNLSTAEIKATNILVPSRSVHDIFDVKAISFFEKTFLNDRLNRKLAETRDTLLPKLMSGEIRISDAEALVENV